MLAYKAQAAIHVQFGTFDEYVSYLQINNNNLDIDPKRHALLNDQIVDSGLNKVWAAVGDGGAVEEAYDRALRMMKALLRLTDSTTEDMGDFAGDLRLLITALNTSSDVTRQENADAMDALEKKATDSGYVGILGAFLLSPGLPAIKQIVATGVEAKSKVDGAMSRASEVASLVDEMKSNAEFCRTDQSNLHTKVLAMIASLSDMDEQQDAKKAAKVPKPIMTLVDEFAAVAETAQGAAAGIVEVNFQALASQGHDSLDMAAAVKEMELMLLRATASGLHEPQAEHRALKHFARFSIAASEPLKRLRDAADEVEALHQALTAVDNLAKLSLEEASMSVVSQALAAGASLSTAWLRLPDAVQSKLAEDKLAIEQRFSIAGCVEQLLQTQLAKVDDSVARLVEAAVTKPGDAGVGALIAKNMAAMKEGEHQLQQLASHSGKPDHANAKVAMAKALGNVMEALSSSQHELQVISNCSGTEPIKDAAVENFFKMANEATRNSIEHALAIDVAQLLNLFPSMEKDLAEQAVSAISLFDRKAAKDM